MKKEIKRIIQGKKNNNLGDKKNNTFVLSIHDKQIKNSSEVELLV